MHLSHIRPLSVGEILDGAFALYRRHFADFFAVSLLTQLPLVGVWLVFLALASRISDSETLTVLFGLFSLLALPFQLVAAILPLGALTRMAADAYLGNAISRRDAVRYAWSRFLSLWGAVTVMGLAVTLGLLLLVVPGVIAWIILFATVPVIMIEGRGVNDAISRSQTLARGAWRPILAVMLVVLVIVVLPLGGAVAASFGLAGLMSDTATQGPVFEAASAAAQGLIGALFAPLSMIATTLLYYDRRIRAEAFGLEADIPGLETA